MEGPADINALAYMYELSDNKIGAILIIIIPMINATKPYVTLKGPKYEIAPNTILNIVRILVG